MGYSGTRSPSRAGFFVPALLLGLFLEILQVTPVFAASISGRVFERSTGVSIPGAVVRLDSSTTAAMTLTTLSDSTGFFSFDGLALGDWMLSAEMIGYRLLRRTISLRHGLEVVDVPLESQPLRMEPMVVWARRDGESRHTPAYVETIPVEILHAPGADLAQALDAATNVNVRRYGGLGSFSTLSIRGSTAEQVQVYLDGVPLNQALGGGVNLGNLPLSGVESVHIYRGATPARFGGNSLGGVVHIRTASLSHANRAHVRAQSGSFGTQQVGMSVSGPWKRWEYLALSEFNTSENNFRFWDDNGTQYNLDDDGWARRVNSDFHSFRGLVKLGRGFGEKRLQVHNTFDLSYSGISGTGIHQARHSRLDSWRNLSEANFHGPWAGGFGGYALRGYYSVTTNEYKDLHGEVGFGAQHDRNTTLGAGIRGEVHAVVPERGLVTLFAAGHSEDFEPENLLQENGPSIHARRYRGSLGAEMESLPLMQRFTLTAGGQVERLDDRLLTRQGFLASAFESGRHSTESIWGFRLGTTMELSKSLFLKAHRGNYQRPPSFFELFGDRGSVVGDPDLVSEEGDKWDLGLDARNLFGGAVQRAEVVYYKNAVKNLIRFVQSTQQVSEPHNIDETRLSGLETRFNLSVSLVRIGGSYVYQRSQNRGPLAYERGNDLPNDPRHRFGLQLSAGKSGNGLRYAFDRESRNFLDRANLNPIPARTVHTVGFDLLVTAGAGLSVEVRNLGNNQVADVWGYPLPGRSYFISARFERRFER